MNDDRTPEPEDTGADRGRTPEGHAEPRSGTGAARRPGPGRQPLPEEKTPGAGGERPGGEPAAADASSGAPTPPAPAPGAGAVAPAPVSPRGEEGVTGRQRLRAALWPPRVSRAQLIVALLLCVLGLGLAIQVRSTSDASVLRGARQEDLVRILDEIGDQTQRLQDEQQRLEEQRTELENSSDQAEEARRQTEQKEQQLGVLAGTVAAEGPGLTITVSAPQGAVDAYKLLDAIQELRAAGAEAIQINDVRVVAGTFFTQDGDRVRIDGQRVEQPFRIRAIGDPQDLEPALNIPGGVVQSLEKEQATVAVTREEKIVVDALRAADRPDYARSSPQ
ncbi:DUF881 domain-containing protein [Streptomyces sp. WAC 00631]|uniref:DUF881 domain-containing protein n=1 Tax=Streptomyces sp. WAC 00631 TaxID=2203201 RepID=UPI000F7747CE|nr:DUF881 domain-containing protein [Streptomyces sp. WAC 00631]MCC5037268.1 DUF881 domain-containing protein [Streptomyces sp. WAC 00631]